MCPDIVIIPNWVLRIVWLDGERFEHADHVHDYTLEFKCRLGYSLKYVASLPSFHTIVDVRKIAAVAHASHNDNVRWRYLRARIRTVSKKIWKYTPVVDVVLVPHTKDIIPVVYLVPAKQETRQRCVRSPLEKPLR